VADWPLRSLDIRCLVFEVSDSRDRDTTIAALAREQFVESAQRLSTFDVSSDDKPQAVSAQQPLQTQSGYNDPYRNLQYGFDEMQIAGAHRWATGKGVRVAVIDTGLDTRHPELRERVTGIRNFVDRDGDAFNADVHGTAVAGVIAAASNNRVGFVGVAPEADLLGLKACWKSEGDGRTARCSTFTLAKALNFAIEQGVDIINLSLGGPADPLLGRLVAKALERNILVIGAVTPKWPGGFPAGVNGVVAVSNVTATDASGSLIAPGTQVLSTKPQSEYDFYSGSSFSTAYVAGVAALIRQRKPHLPGNVARDLIVTTAQQGGPRTPNACRALARLTAAGAVAEGDCTAVQAGAKQR
jgi:subtilisin family serine protease